MKESFSTRFSVVMSLFERETATAVLNCGSSNDRAVYGKELGMGVCCWWIGRTTDRQSLQDCNPIRGVAEGTHWGGNYGRFCGGINE
jgi:hypothetical protein